MKRRTKIDRDPSRRHDAIYFIEAINCNPNGDPDNAGSSRLDTIHNEGFASRSSVKRRIRDFFIEFEKLTYFYDGAKATPKY